MLRAAAIVLAVLCLVYAVAHFAAAAGLWALEPASHLQVGLLWVATMVLNLRSATDY